MTNFLPKITPAAGYICHFWLRHSCPAHSWTITPIISVFCGVKVPVSKFLPNSCISHSISCNCKSIYTQPNLSINEGNNILLNKPYLGIIAPTNLYITCLDEWAIFIKIIPASKYLRQIDSMYEMKTYSTHCIPAFTLLLIARCSLIRVVL